MKPQGTSHEAFMMQYPMGHLWAVLAKQAQRWGCLWRLLWSLLGFWPTWRASWGAIQRDPV